MATKNNIDKVDEDEFNELLKQATSIDTNPSGSGGYLPNYESGFNYIVPEGYDVYNDNSVNDPQLPQNVFMSEANPFGNLNPQDLTPQNVVPDNPFIKQYTGDTPMPSQSYAGATPSGGGGLIGVIPQQMPYIMSQLGSEQMRRSVVDPSNLPQRPEVSMIDPGTNASQSQKPNSRSSIFGDGILSGITEALGPLAKKVAEKKGLLTSQDTRPSIDQSKGGIVNDVVRGQLSQQAGNYTPEQIASAQALRGNANVSPSSDTSAMAQFRATLEDTANNDAGFKINGAPSERPPVEIVEKSTQFIKDVQSEEAKQPGFFARKLQDPTFFAKAAIAFNTMRLNPDQALAAAMTQRIKNIRTDQASAKTAEWLRTNNYPKLATAVANKSLSASDAVKLSLARGSKQILTKEQYKKLFGTDIPSKYEGSILVYDSITGDIDQVGGGGLTIDQTKESEETKIKAKAIGKRMEAYIEAGSQSSSALITIQQMKALNERGSIDAVPAFVRSTLPIWAQNDETQMYQALLNGLAQTQRVSGTGSQSDKDVELLIQKVGSIGANARARNFSLSALEKKAKINLERSDIASKWQVNELTSEQAINALREIDKQTIFTEEEKELLESLETKGIGGNDPVKIEEAFKGVSDEIVKEIKNNPEALQLFLNSTPEARKAFIESFKKPKN